jgi:hypothetical protein
MKNAALLIIDVQRGAFDGERCEPAATTAPALQRSMQPLAARA